MAAKRVRVDSKFQPKKSAKIYHSGNDRISQLSDDILVDILSLLSLKEAARTSILSSRWVNVWKQTPCLDFNAKGALVKIAEHYDSCQYKLCSVERIKYVKWVNRVLQSHKGDTLKKFRVCFDLSKSSSKSITRWVEFALARHVEKLELDFSPKYQHGYPPTHYAFPEEILTSSSIDFKPLKELCFECVNVTAEAIEFFLHNCPLLEKVVVNSTNSMSNLAVCGPSLVLKHLEMGKCCTIKSLKISAPNLVSLIVDDVQELVLESVPMLVEVSVACTGRPDSVSKLLTALSCCISQLEVLNLLLGLRTEVTHLSMFPELPKLKKLVIKSVAEGNKTLMPLTHLIRAAPYLQEFVIKLIPWGPSRLHRKAKDTIRIPHQHLKLVKFCGYYGRSSDVQLVRYFFKNCIALERIIIDPKKIILDPKDSLLPPCPKELDEAQIARDYARKQLEARVPWHVELVIL